MNVIPLRHFKVLYRMHVNCNMETIHMCIGMEVQRTAVYGPWRPCPVGNIDSSDTTDPMLISV